MFFKRTDNLTTNLTSYDFLKFLTLSFMIVDHIGAFFFPEELWWRVIGRLGFPAWFFLAGYSKGHQIGQTLWIGAALLIASNVAFGQYMFPMNALVSFICIRLLMTHYYRAVFANWEILIYVCVAFLALSLPTNYLFEYGTLVFLMAMFGYAVRNKDDLRIGKFGRIVFCIFATFSVILLQVVTFAFSVEQSILCTVLLSLASVILFFFKADEYPELTKKMPSFITSIIQFGGRYTLEVYVFHLMAIKAYLLYKDYGHYLPFEPSYFPNFPIP